MPRISSLGWVARPENLRNGGVGEGRRAAVPHRLLGPRQLLPFLYLPPLLSSDRPFPQAPLWGGGVGKGLLGCMRSAEAPPSCRIV